MGLAVGVCPAHPFGRSRPAGDGVVRADRARVLVAGRQGLEGARWGVGLAVVVAPAGDGLVGAGRGGVSIVPGPWSCGGCMGAVGGVKLIRQRTKADSKASIDAMLSICGLQSHSTPTRNRSSGSA